MILDDIDLVAPPAAPVPAVVTAPRPAHAKTRPPSAAYRWLGCPASVTVVPLYPNEEGEAALKGTKAHLSLENGIVWGTLPDTDDVDADLNILEVLNWVREAKEDYGKDCKVYAEQVYDIPETGEYGTCDVTFVTPRVIHIADYKNGYVAVDVNMNPQLLLYLLGAIAMHGERSKYYITVLQPNFHHRDGPFRTMEIDNDQIEWFRKEVAYSMNNDNEFNAGKHCKTSYCPHRASCLEFHTWARTDANLAWFPSDVHALDDTQLAQALDYADTLHGLRDELRKEAMRRMIQQDRQIEGYKIVKSRTDRAFASDTARDEAFKLAIELGATEENLYTRKPETVAGLERFFKEKFKHFGNGKWKLAWNENVQQHIREFSGSLTLEKAIDGRPAHSRGNEFGAIAPAQPSTTTII